ncbi:MAG: hypothetical protein L3J11_11700 [Draconibacterium sp.]|nr:hypothetical protein [Draconibacterium sp.]
MSRFSNRDYFYTADRNPLVPEAGVSNSEKNRSLYSSTYKERFSFKKN